MKYYSGPIYRNNSQEFAYCCAHNGIRAKELLKEFGVDPTYFQTYWNKDIQKKLYRDIAKDQEGVWLIEKRYSEDHKDYIKIK